MEYLKSNASLRDSAHEPIQRFHLKGKLIAQWGTQTKHLQRNEVKIDYIHSIAVNFFVIAMELL